MIRTQSLCSTCIGLFTLFALSTAEAGSMRCGIHVISISDDSPNGPSKYEVLKKCGEPSFRESNVWMYYRGSGQPRRILRFDDDGRLIAVS